MTEAVKQALLLVPTKPGVYLMKDKDEEINRLRQQLQQKQAQ